MKGWNGEKRNPRSSLGQAEPRLSGPAGMAETVDLL